MNFLLDASAQNVTAEHEVHGMKEVQGNINPRTCACTCTGRGFETVTQIHTVSRSSGDCTCECPCLNFLIGLSSNTKGSRSGDVKEKPKQVDSLLEEVKSAKILQENERALKKGCTCKCSDSGCKCACARINSCKCLCDINAACTCTCTCSRSSQRELWFAALQLKKAI